MSFARVALAAALLAATPAMADFNDKKPITATVTGATPSGYPRTMVEGALALVFVYLRRGPREIDVSA